MQQVRSGACCVGPVDGGHNLEDGKDMAGKDLSCKSNYSVQDANSTGSTQGRYSKHQSHVQRNGMKTPNVSVLIAALYTGRGNGREKYVTEIQK